MGNHRFALFYVHPKVCFLGILAFTGLISSPLHATTSLSQSAKQCDESAAIATNPDNPSYIIPVPSDSIKADKAIASCTQAMAEYPKTPRFQFQLARAYDKDQQYTQAVSLYKPLAEQGYAPAQSNLGYAFGSGNGVPFSNEIAVQWYKRAAAQGYAPAQNNLGSGYYCGRGIDQSFTQATKLFKKSALQGYPIAEYNLARMYEEGSGITPSIPKAIKWYQRASNHGVEAAVYKIQELSK